MKVKKSVTDFKVPDDIEIIKNVEYGRGDGRSLKMDILRPKRLSDKLIPIIWIHGGGWRGGTKEKSIPFLIPFAQNGYFCVANEYRLSKEAKFPAQIEDCKCAVRYLRANADEYNIESVNQLLSLSYSKLDKAVQKGMIHRNTAASKKASLAKAIKKREQSK